MARPGGLGRGLGALIPTGVVSNDAGRARRTSRSRRSARTRNSRASTSTRSRSPRWRSRSARSASSSRFSCARGGDGFELIAGERRWRAARRIGLQTIPAIVRTADDASMLQQAIVENVQREELNPLEEAAAYQQLIEDFSLTHDEVATRVGKSRTTITNTLRLLQLPPSIQRHLKDGRSAWATPGRCSARPTARSRSSSPSASVAEDLSVREVEEAIRNREESQPANDRRAPRAVKLRPPGLLELEELLGDYLETRVRITMGAAPRPGRDRVRDPRGPRAHLPGHDRGPPPGAEAGPARVRARRRPAARRPGADPSTSASRELGPARRQHRRARRLVARRRARTRPRPSASRAGGGRCARPARRRRASTARSDSVSRARGSSPPSDSGRSGSRSRRSARRARSPVVDARRTRRRRTRLACAASTRVVVARGVERDDRALLAISRRRGRRAERARARGRRRGRAAGRGGGAGRGGARRARAPLATDPPASEPTLHERGDRRRAAHAVGGRARVRAGTGASAVSVSGPRMPSSRPASKPSALSRRWSSLTSSPRSIGARR